MSILLRDSELPRDVGTSEFCNCQRHTPEPVVAIEIGPGRMFAAGVAMGVILTLLVLGVV